VRIRNTVAPGLVDVSFKSSTLSDVLLDSMDVALVEVSLEGTGDPDFAGVIDSDSTDLYTDEAVWDLTGPVSITATETNGASAAVADAAFGTDDYIDLIVQGKLITHPGESDEMVTFTSQSPDDANGDNWGGIFVDQYAAETNIEHADISHAFTGVMVYYGDDVTIECSHVHHCNGVAVHVYGASEGGVVVDDNTIERGSGMDTEVGNECLVLEAADVCSVTNNLLELGAIVNGGNPFVRTALRVQNTRTFCESAPTSSHAQVIEGNRIVGSDFTAPQNATGLLVNWGCAGTNRTVTIDENYIDEWPTIGAHFTECSGVDVGCNNVVNNTIGIKFERATTTSGAAVEFHGNNIALADDDDSDRATEIRRPNQAEFGPSAASTGDNFFRIHDLKTLVFEPVFDDSVLSAQENYWYRDAALQTVGDSISVRIKSGGELFGNDPDVDFASFYTSLDDSCYVELADLEEVGCSGAESRGLPVRPQPVLARNEAAPSQRVLEIFVTGLGAVRPNPLVSSTTIELTVGTNDPGRYRLEVFDVRGRRVQTLLDGFPDPGRHEVVWRGRDQTGRAVAPGVYFVRMVGPGYTENKKVVLLR
jgi:hypothetical protein